MTEHTLLQEPHLASYHRPLGRNRQRSLSERNWPHPPSEGRGKGGLERFGRGIENHRREQVRAIRGLSNRFREELGNSAHYARMGMTSAVSFASPTGRITAGLVGPESSSRTSSVGSCASASRR